MKKIHITLLLFIFLLAACGKQAQAVPPTTTTVPATEALPLTPTSLPPTETPLPTDTPIPTPTQDPAVFGAIGTGELQAGAIESVASAIFNKTLDVFVANGSVQEYQIISVSVFPGGDGLLAEVIYSVKHLTPSGLLTAVSNSPMVGSATAVVALIFSPLKRNIN